MLMNHQAKIIGMRRLAHSIEAERIKIMAGVPDKTTHAHVELTQKIESWQRTFLALTKELKSQSHFNHMIYEKNRFSSNAHAARDRFRSGQHNVQELSQALLDVEQSLRNLAAAFFGGKGGAAAALEGIAHVMGNWQEATKHSKEGLTGQAPSQLQAAVVEVRAHLPSQSPAMPAPGVIDIFTLILAYFAFIKSHARNR